MCFTFHNTVSQWIAERSAHEFRLGYCRALLKQDMVYFDCGNADGITLEMKKDIQSLRRSIPMFCRFIAVCSAYIRFVAIFSFVILFCEGFTLFIASSFFAFYYGWHVALCAFSMLPFMAIGGVCIGAQDAQDMSNLSMSKLLTSTS